MIQAWESVSPQPASQPRLLFMLTTPIFYWRIKRFAPSSQLSRNSAPATKSETWTSPKVHLTRKVRFQLHQIVHLPQKVTLELRQIALLCFYSIVLSLYYSFRLYTTLWLHYSLTLLFLYSSNYSFTLLTILVFFYSETWPYYSLTLLLLIILLFQSTILLLYQSFTLLFFDFVVLCCYSSILRFFYFLALLFFDSAISFVYWKFLNKMSFDYYMIDLHSIL